MSDDFPPFPEFGTHEATPVSEHRRAQADTAPAPVSASGSEDGDGHRRSFSPVSVHSMDRDDRTTRDSYESPQLDRHAYPMDCPEPRHRSASPVTRRLIDERDREVEELAARYPDLQDWLEETGWNNPDFRLRHLDRIHRMAEIERATSQLQMEFEHDKARLKKPGEPDSEVMWCLGCPTPSPHAPMSWKPGPPSVTTSLKRKRSEESDNKRDDGMSPKYFRTDHNHHEHRWCRRLSWFP